MILYFSATGNGKYISEQIAEKTDETWYVYRGLHP